MDFDWRQVGEEEIWNEPTPKELEVLPGLYERQLPMGDITIHMHFVVGDYDWYAAEFCPKEKRFFCYMIVDNDLENAHWGYVSLDELREIRIPNGLEVDRDIHWTPTKASEVERIDAAFRAQGRRL